MKKMTRKIMYLTPKPMQRTIKLKIMTKNSTEVDNRSENDQNDAKEVHTDDSDEKTEES